MVSSTLIKLSSPVAKSTLIALGVALFIDAILTIFASVQYPYLVDYLNDDLYISSSNAIPIVYSPLSIGATLIAISTALACYRSDTNYVLIHAGITGVFLPVTILVYFTTISARYKVADYVDDYRQMIADYRIRSSIHKQQISVEPSSSNHDTSREHLKSGESASSSASQREMLSSFINLIDLIQSKFSCCGVESTKDWTNHWDGYIPPTCCNKPASGDTKPQWASRFALNPNHEFKYCEESNSHNYGCLVALRESESSKYAWLSDLMIFMILVTIANTIVSLLLFGLNKTDLYNATEDDRELSMVGASSRPRPSIAAPTMIGMRHRPSVVVQTMGQPNAPETMTARAQAVRFNISTTPRSSISGPSKFSPAARRVATNKPLETKTSDKRIQFLMRSGRISLNNSQDGQEKFKLQGQFCVETHLFRYCLGNSDD